MFRLTQIHKNVKKIRIYNFNKLSLPDNTQK